MKFIDLGAQQRRIRSDIDNRIKAVLEHGKYIMGPEVREIETRLSDYTGVNHAISCSSGTDALLLALMAYGVGPGDAVFTTPYTFVATAEVICLLGATPVFVDIESDTFNMDPDSLTAAVEAVNGPSPVPGGDPSVPLNPRGIIAVDMFGLPADYGRIMQVADRHGLFVIQDGAQSMGAEYHGKKTGGLAHVGCTSFFPAKPLGCYGDGGMCFTDDDELAQVMISLRIHGQGGNKYDNIRIGINGRLDTLQAAVLLAKMEVFDREIDLRQKVADRYNDAFRSLGDALNVPEIPDGYTSVWAQYTLTFSSIGIRDHVARDLKAAGIPSAIYYPTPLHLQTAFKSLGYKTGDFAVSEEMAQKVISLPMHPYLQTDDQESVIKTVLDTVKGP